MPSLHCPSHPRSIASLSTAPRPISLLSLAPAPASSCRRPSQPRPSRHAATGPHRRLDAREVRGPCHACYVCMQQRHRCNLETFVTRRCTMPSSRAARPAVTHRVRSKNRRGSAVCSQQKTTVRALLVCAVASDSLVLQLCSESDADQKDTGIPIHVSATAHAHIPPQRRAGPRCPLQSLAAQ